MFLAASFADDRDFWTGFGVALLIVGFALQFTGNAFASRGRLEGHFSLTRAAALALVLLLAASTLCAAQEPVRGNGPPSEPVKTGLGNGPPSEPDLPVPEGEGTGPLDMQTSGTDSTEAEPAVPPVEDRSDEDLPTREVAAEEPVQGTGASDEAPGALDFVRQWAPLAPVIALMIAVWRFATAQQRHAELVASVKLAAQQPVNSVSLELLKDVMSDQESRLIGWMVRIGAAAVLIVWLMLLVIR